MKALLFLPILLLLNACAGYQLGGQKPDKLRHIRMVHLPLAQNRTLFPRAEALATNSLADALTQDGTYRLSTQEKSDATLILTVAKIDYSQARSSEQDSLLSEELEMRVTLDWQLFEKGPNTKPIEEGSSTGSTRLFARGNLQTARNGALPDALMRASQNIISRLADGF